MAGLQPSEKAIARSVIEAIAEYLHRTADCMEGTVITGEHALRMTADTLLESFAEHEAREATRQDLAERSLRAKS